MQSSEQSREILEIMAKLNLEGWSAQEVAFNEVLGSPLWIVLGRRRRTKIQRSSRSRVEAWRMILEEAQLLQLSH